MPFPDVGTNDDSTLWRDLVEAAKAQEQIHRSGCAYLGLPTGYDAFEPDPAKWPAHLCPPSGKNDAAVAFEWLHVRTQGAPHRVIVRARNALSESRSIPHSPLKACAPSGLTFTDEFADALAKLVHEDVQFKGIAFESDKPQHILTVS